jgi:hypothetical protein
MSKEKFEKLNVLDDSLISGNKYNPDIRIFGVYYPNGNLYHYRNKNIALYDILDKNIDPESIDILFDLNLGIIREDDFQNRVNKKQITSPDRYIKLPNINGRFNSSENGAITQNKIKNSLDNININMDDYYYCICPDGISATDCINNNFEPIIKEYNKDLDKQIEKSHIFGQSAYPTLADYKWNYIIIDHYTHRKELHACYDKNIMDSTNHNINHLLVQDDFFKTKGSSLNDKNHILDYGFDKILSDIKKGYKDLKIKHDKQLKKQHDELIAILKTPYQLKEFFDRYPDYS